MSENEKKLLEIIKFYRGDCDFPIVTLERAINAKFNMLSPDRIPISQIGFDTIKEMETYFNSWINGYKKQGYYSSNRGRIEIEDIECRCERIIVF